MYINYFFLIDKLKIFYLNSLSMFMYTSSIYTKTWFTYNFFLVLKTNLMYFTLKN